MNIDKIFRIRGNFLDLLNELDFNYSISTDKDLKYNDKDKEQIQYFSHLTSFFKEIDKNISFKNHVFHYDFCQLRCTDSKEMLDVLNSNYKLLAHHLLKIIDIVKPEIIFVFNAFYHQLGNLYFE